MVPISMIVEEAATGRVSRSRRAKRCNPYCNHYSTAAATVPHGESQQEGVW